MAPPPAPPPRTSQTTDYYYFFVAFAAIAIMLLVSNIIAVGCCSPSRILHAIRTRVRRRTTMAGDPETSRSHVQQPQYHVIPLCKYSKGNDKDQQTQTECSVCLSLFIEGEELRQLPKCKHLFHAPCIDMWLFSHSNCPLCRADVFSEPASRSSRLRLLPMESRTDAAVVVFI